MSNGRCENPWERLAKLWATVGKLLLDDNRTPEEVCEVLEAIVSEKKPVFAIWKTLKLGTGLRTADDFRSALKRGGNRISDWANDILGKPAFKAATEATEVDMVKVTVAELGFKNGATRRDIYQRAKEFGLELCPAEVGPQLRLQYQDQSLNEWLVIAMEPISDSDGDLSVFVVERLGDGRWLHGGRGHPDRSWDSGNQFVFLRRK